MTGSDPQIAGIFPRPPDERTLRDPMMRAAALFAVCLFVPACADVECARNTDCGDHRRCELNRCVSDCAADRDCPSGQLCDPNGACVARPDAKVVDVTADLSDTPVTTDVKPADAGADARDDIASDVPRDAPDADVPAFDVIDASRDVATDAAEDATDASLDVRESGNDPPDVPPFDAPGDISSDDGAALDVATDRGVDVSDVSDASDVRDVSDVSDVSDVADVSDASGCVRTFACEAMTADAECGVVTSTGRRYPDLGRPYCADRLTREGCSCHLLRCVSPGPLCAGTYVATFREWLISGCNGVAGELSGTCNALWNVVQTWPAVSVISDRTMYNVSLSWAFADYTQMFTVTAPTQVRLVVQQSTWFSDVSGVGNSGRSEVARVSVAAAP
ncbi:MAG: hypothetical protein U0326_22675 [Polyangiales bacterium]